DYAGTHGDKKSTSGECQFLGRRLISWQCKKQTIVSTSSCKAEYVAATSCCGQWFLFTSAGRVTFCWLFPIPVGDLVFAGHILFLLGSASEVSLLYGVKGLMATIDGTSYTVTEASIRSALQLDDLNAIDTMSNEEIFAGLRDIGYATEGKFTFFKNKFSPQWKFLIHTLIRCLSPKSGSWNQFASNITIALICLSTRRKYNFSNMIFNGMCHNVSSRTKFLMHSSPSPIPFGLAPRSEVASTETILDIPSSSRPSEPTLETITSPIRDDDTGGGSFHKSPPSPPPATPPRNPTEIVALEAELKATKILHMDTVVLFAKRIKKLESKLKTKKRKLVLSDSKNEEEARKSQELDALLHLANATLHDPSDSTTPSKPANQEQSLEQEISPTTLDDVLTLSQSKARAKEAMTIYKCIKKQVDSAVELDSVGRVDSAVGRDSASRLDYGGGVISSGRVDFAVGRDFAGRLNSAGGVVSAGGADSVSRLTSAAATPSSPVIAPTDKELANQQATILEAKRQELLKQELKQSLDVEQVSLDSLLAQRVAEEQERESRASTAQMVELMNQQRKAIAEMKAKAKRDKPMTPAQQKNSCAPLSRIRETTFVSVGATIAAGDPIPTVTSVSAASSVPARTPIATGVFTTAGASGSASEATEIIPTEFRLGEIHVITTADGTVKRFSTLMELMYWAGRADLIVLYGMVLDKYKIERATGIGLGLWSDLRTLITAREDRDASIIWDDQDQKPKRKDTQVPQPSGPTENVADEAVYKELGDRLGRRIDTNKDITLVNNADIEMFDVDDLGGDEVFVAGQNDNVVKEVVNAAQVSTATTIVTITTKEITLAQALKALKTSKPKMFDRAFRRVKTFEDFRLELGEGKEKRAEEELEQEITKKQKVEDDKEKIYKEEKKSYYQIVSSDGKSQMYMIFSQMLERFKMEDLEYLYKLVKARYGSTRPVENIDYLLWTDMKILFRPHVEDEIYMLVVNKYPLTQPTLSMMLGRKLQIDYEGEMAYELCKLIKKQLKKRDLQIADEEGIDCLPNSTIFVQLALMGPKSTAWNEFSSTMAFAIICLATDQKFNFSKWSFDSMLRNLDNVSGTFLTYPRVGKGFSCKVTPLFQKMVIQNQFELGEGSTMPTDPDHTPTILQPSSIQPQKTQKHKKPKRKDTQVPHPSGPTKNVTDEAIHTELGDRLVRAATTTSSLEVEQDSGNITNTQSKATPNKPSSQGTNSGGGPRVLDLEKIKATQCNEIDSLKRRIKTLKKRNMSRTQKLKRLYNVGFRARVESSKDEDCLGKDASKQGMRIDAIDVDKDITLVNDVDNEMFAVDDLGGEELFVAGQNDNVVEEVVNAAQVSTTATTVTITTKEITLAQALEALETSKPKDKSKGIMIEELVKPKKKDQIMLDVEAALKLQPKFDEEERLTREKKKYPLTPPTLSMMLEKKLQIDYESEMAYQPCKLIKKQLNKRIVRIKSLLDAVGITATQSDPHSVAKGIENKEQWEGPEFQDTASSVKEKVAKVFTFYRTEEKVNPKEEDAEPCVILGRLFMILAKGIFDFRKGIITIHPKLYPFLDNSEEAKKFEDDWDHLLYIAFGDILKFDKAGLPPFVCKMGKRKRNKKRALKNFQLCYFDVGPSLSNGKPLTEEEATWEALAIDICK
nr:ribonuclease H-like domain, reverse transcriptase, RNA-dependent DNA polymerase [Tanacetum cinerariifolium]